MRADLGLAETPETPAGSAPAHAAAETRERTSLVIEALADLGGVIVLVAAGLLADLVLELHADDIVVMAGSGAAADSGRIAVGAWGRDVGVGGLPELTRTRGRLRSS